MGAASAAAENLTLIRNGDSDGIPPDVLAALIDSHVSRLQGDLIMILFSGVVYGVALQFVVRYFSLYWRGVPEFGIARDSAALRVYVVTLCVIATGYLGVIVGSAWQHGTLSVNYGGVLDPDPTALQVADWWCLCAMFILLNGYWIFARCWKVTKSIVLRILGAVLFLVSAGSLIAVAAISLRLKMDSTIGLDDLHRCVCIGLCIALATDVFCALVLCYELIYKRRKSLAKSTLIQQFLVVALQSSLLTALANVPGTIAIVYHMATEDSDALVATITASKLYVYTSFACVVYTLVSRATFTTVVAPLDTGKLRPSFLPSSSAQHQQQLQMQMQQRSSGNIGGGWGGQVVKVVSRAVSSKDTEKEKDGKRGKGRKRGEELAGQVSISIQVDEHVDDGGSDELSDGEPRSRDRNSLAVP